MDVDVRFNVISTALRFLLPVILTVQLSLSLCANPTGAVYPESGTVKRQVVDEGGDNCGPDNYCITSLRVAGRYLLDHSDGVYVVGDSRRLAVLLNVSNSGELAMGVRLSVTYDPLLVFVRVDRVETRSRGVHGDTRGVACTTATFSELQCDLTAPVSHGHYLAVTLLMDAAMVTVSSKEISVSVTVTSRSHEERNPDDNSLTLPPLTVLTRADLRISGLSDPSSVGSGGASEEVSVLFRVSNAGPSDADVAVVHLYLPVTYGDPAAGHVTLATLDDRPRILDSDVRCELSNRGVISEPVVSEWEEEWDNVYRLVCGADVRVTCQVYACLVSTGIDRSIDSLLVSIPNLRIHSRNILSIKESAGGARRQALYTVSAGVTVGNNSEVIDTYMDNNLVNVDVSVDVSEPDPVHLEPTPPDGLGTKGTENSALMARATSQHHYTQLTTAATAVLLIIYITTGENIYTHNHDIFENFTF